MLEEHDARHDHHPSSYEEELAETPHADLPPGLWSVRTIDDSPSHQAEVVIYNKVQAKKPGFLVKEERMAVITTHAQAVTILVGKESMLTGGKY